MLNNVVLTSVILKQNSIGKITEDVVLAFQLTRKTLTHLSSNLRHSPASFPPRRQTPILETRNLMAYIQYGRNALRQIIKETNVQSHDRLMQPLLYACQGLRYRKLDVILTTSIEKLGKAGETVKVAPGYFRNHLMPKLLAVPNIDKFAYLIKEQRKIYQPKEEEVQVVAKKNVEDKTKEYEKAAYRLLNSRLVLRRSINTEKFRARSTKDDPIVLRSPVTKDELVAEIARQLCIQIEPENLQLPTPLETFGQFEVQLRMPKSIPLPEGRFNWALRVKIRGK